MDGRETVPMMLYLRLIGARLRAQTQYPVAFLAELVGFGTVTALEFMAVVLLLRSFHSVHGWALPEIAILYGISSSSLGIAELIGRGFDAPFEQLMQTGRFDMVLTRPLGAFFQVLATEFQLRRLGRVVQGWLALAYGLLHAPIRWDVARVLLLPIGQISGVAIYLSLIVIGATICFWTIRTPDVMHMFTDGGNVLLSYPLSIYSRPIRAIFTFVVPLAFINYPLALTLLGKADPHGFPAQLAWASPLVAAVFFGMTLAFWRFGVGRYTSAGS
ncbi:ABC transporter permease [Chloroflexia bacterium SDU3-3]|nr:ABC transporter permease [Chloroflexia bacterium SDU3-3]